MIALPASMLDFGTIEVGRADSRGLEIRNDGPGPLNVTDVRTDIPGITFSARVFTVAAGEVSTITILVDAQTEGLISGIVEIISNDPDMMSSTVTVSATAEIDVADARADFDGSGTIDFRNPLVDPSE